MAAWQFGRGLGLVWFERRPLSVLQPALLHSCLPAADNYYLLPFCKPKGGAAKHKWGGLGEVLQGNELIDSQLAIQFKGAPPACKRRRPWCSGGGAWVSWPGLREERGRGRTGPPGALLSPHL